MNKSQILSQLREVQEIISRCISSLEGNMATPSTKRHGKTNERASEINFDLNERNFVKSYGAKMNGQKKFVLLLAYMTKGKIGIDVEIAKISAMWRKMTAKELLGYSYNDKYPTTAKTDGWVDSKKQGTYHLLNTWKQIFD